MGAESEAVCNSAWPSKLRQQFGYAGKIDETRAHWMMFLVSY
jgi:hypothetical protein